MQMELYICVAVPGFMALFFLAIMAFAGISSRWTDDSDREWWGRATGWLLAVALGWLLIKRPGCVRTTFAEVDVVIYHYRGSGSACYHFGRP